MAYGGLGRIKIHDPRSRAYGIAEAGTKEAELSKSDIVSVVHERHVPIFNQGQVGSCTGNAEAGELGCSPHFLMLNSTMQAKLATGSQDVPLHLYSMATHLDRYRGSYPPEDTGSAGLYVAKAAYKLGYAGKYHHAFSIGGLVTGLQKLPMIVGTVWKTGMNEPDPHGFVHLKGSVEGGHEYLCRQYVRHNDKDPFADDNVLVFDNSWGTDWGINGRFSMEIGEFKQLLLDGGDATRSQPLTVAEPQAA